MCEQIVAHVRFSSHGLTGYVWYLLLAVLSSAHFWKNISLSHLTHKFTKWLKTLPDCLALTTLQWVFECVRETQESMLIRVNQHNVSKASI